MEGEMEVTGRKRRRSKQLQVGVIEKRKYWNLKKIALDLSVKSQ